MSKKTFPIEPEALETLCKTYPTPFISMKSAGCVKMHVDCSRLLHGTLDLKNILP